jgi:signal peptidase I
MDNHPVTIHMPKHDEKIIAGWLDLLKGLVPHGAVVELPVLSGSMAPLIMPGSRVHIRSCRSNEIRRGDIIVFKEGNSLTIHRLLVRMPLYSGSLLYQKGDANQFGKWIRSSLVVGVVDSVRDISGTISVLSHRAEKKASLQQLGYAFLNLSLYYPRSIKQWLKKM